MQTAKESALPAQPVAAALDERVNLLEKIDPRRDTKMGVWPLEAGVLRVPRFAGSMLIVPYSPPPSYRFVMEIQREIPERHPFGIVLLVGEAQVLVTLDAVDRLVSLSVGNFGPSRPRPPMAFEPRNDSPSLFSSGQPLRVECFVTPGSLKVLSRGVSMFWEGNPNSSILPDSVRAFLPRDCMALINLSRGEFKITELTIEPLRAPPPDTTIVQQRPQSSSSGMAWPGDSSGPQAPRRGDVAMAQPGTTPAAPPSTSSAGEGATSPQQAVAPVPSEPVPPEVEQWKDSVGIIQYSLGSGTGFVVKEGVIATNAHVVEELFEEEIKVTFTGSESSRCRAIKILYEDPERDLCLFSVETTHKPIPLAERSELPRGDKIMIISNPSVGETELVIRNAVTSGAVAALVNMGGYDFYQLSATVNPGSSGGPVLNLQGQVVGVVAMKATQEGEEEIRTAVSGLDPGLAQVMAGNPGKGVTFAIPLSALRTALTEAEKELQSPTNRWTDIHAARVVFMKSATLGVLYLLQFAVNVPDSVRGQAEAMKLRPPPPTVAAKIKTIDLPPRDKARAIHQVLNGRFGSKLFEFYSTGVEEHLEKLKASKHVAQEDIRLLESLLSSVKKTKGLAEKPPTYYQAYSQAFLTQEESLKNLISQLQKRLTVGPAAYEE